MSEYHESWDALPEEVRDMHRALTSLQEEVEAVDWYNQRQAVCTDESLKEVLIHNRDEEIEHACMTLEWLRRRDPAWDEELRHYLFTDAPITTVEAESKDGMEPGTVKGAGASRADLGIGDLK